MQILFNIVDLKRHRYNEIINKINILINMLSTNLPLLKQNLNNLLSVPPANEGPVYKAAYDAYFNVTNVEVDTENEDSDLKSIVEQAKQDVEQKVKDDAKKFATDFCNGLKDNGFMDTIADEIDAHIKSTKLLITMMPQGIATIVSPVGPCSGSMVIDDTTANIQIL